MKRALYFLIIVFAIFIYVESSQDQCDKTLNYSIGLFDDRFKITKEEFKKNLASAEKFWEDEAGKNLFQYKEGAKFKINLIFDDRQQKTIEADTSKEIIESSESKYESLVSQYTEINDQYHKDLQSYQDSLQAYNKDLAKYNDNVAELNKKGGATESEAKTAEAEFARLEGLVQSLNKKRESINSTVTEIRRLSDQINTLAQNLNKDISKFNQQYGTTNEFDQADYTGKAINVYQFDSSKNLILVLAHEFGHSLDIGHVEGEKSIMYPIVGGQDLNNLSLSNEDILEFRKSCKSITK